MIFSQFSFWFLLVFFFVGIFLFWRIPNLKSQSKRDQIGLLFDHHISVIIPARNEETRLPLLLASLKSQSVLPDEILVVDDSSEDRTADISRQMGGRVIKGLPLQEGWTGKNWACWQGAQAARGDILIFLDADVWLSEEGIFDIISALEKKPGLISIQPYHVTFKAYEQLSAFFNIILMAATNAFTPLGDRLTPGGAFGPCVACKRENYFMVGGHSVSRKVVLESITLGKAFLKKGLKIHLFGGKGSIYFRMFPGGLSELIEGWSKGFGAGAMSLQIPSLLLTSGWIWSCFSVFSGIIKSSLGTGLPFWLALLFYIFFVVQLFWMLYRIGRFHPLTSLLFPIPLTFFALIMLRSLVLIFIIKRVKWHGRDIPQGGGRP